MLCKICREIVFASGRRWGYHREDYHHVNKDPEVEDCTFCSDLRENATKTASDTFPRYQWTLRWLPTTRHGQPSMVVTFRPVDENLEQDSSPEEIKHSSSRRLTAGRVFYLFKKETIQIASHLPQTTETTPNGSLPQIQGWLRECNANHARCRAVRARNNRNPFLPTRLVDVSTDRIHIVESAGAGLPETEPYVTLSHCWGKLTILRLIDENKDRLLNPEIGIEWGELTNTFRDAISVTRQMGIKYIWIDSLCIVQWSSKTAHGDFHQQGQLMHKVYRKSFCNIAAADSGDGEGGLFRPKQSKKEQEGKENNEKGMRSRGREKILPKAVEFQDGMSDEQVKGSWYILQGDYWDRHLLDKILYTRGWVFQERMLAPRLLHFSESQVLWDCATLSASEVLPSGLPPQLDAKSATERHWRERLSLIREEGDSVAAAQVQREVRAGTADDSLEGFWREAVRNYTRCELTSYTADRLKAIWGVAKLVRDGLREEDTDPKQLEEYGAGLWRKNLYMQLAWRVVNPGLASKVRPKDLGELHPSWSWASTIGEIELQPRNPSILEQCYKVRNHKGDEVDFEITPTEKDDLQPELASKLLAVRGNVAKGYWDGKEQMVRSSAFAQDMLDSMDFFPDVVMDEEQMCYLLVLWANENRQGGGIVDHGDHFDEYSDCSEAELEIRRPEQVIHHSGSGLMLLGDGHEGTDRFKRIGSFRFHGLHKEEMGLLVDREGGKNIWIV
ncbi:heterokaryon incompatibility protein-domain-containing protein [Cladorrhinum sp. PSN332]|nr:heterokaryon incompatibility protein-domain-containing protein [Cladorrhinum sp. PSN332]